MTPDFCAALPTAATGGPPEMKLSGENQERTHLRDIFIPFDYHRCEIMSFEESL